jgi:hypothetical protein
MATATIAYAASQNARFSNTQAHLVDLVTRLTDTVANLPPQAQRNWNAGLATAIKAFRKNHPGLKAISNRTLFPLCQAIEKSLGEIVIDTTMQREPDLQWILKIITNFRAYQAQPIQVYLTTNGAFGAWDGQHTALAFYLIATHALGLDYTTVTVPVNVYNMSSRGMIRGTFIGNNSSTGKSAGKKSLDMIDLIQQMIYGVEVDGVTDPEWVMAHAKWKYIKAAGMFITAEKFNNTDRTGAISRLNELFDEKTSVEVVEDFCIYGNYIIQSQATATIQRPFNTKEIPIIVEFFKLCAQNDIRYTKTEIEDLAQHLIDLFDANFDAKAVFWEQVHQATVNTWTNQNLASQLPKSSWGEVPRNQKNTPTGSSFFYHQLKKSWVSTKVKGFEFPKQPYAIYVPNPTDLF